MGDTEKTTEGDESVKLPDQRPDLDSQRVHMHHPPVMPAPRFPMAPLSQAPLSQASHPRPSTPRERPHSRLIVLVALGALFLVVGIALLVLGLLPPALKTVVWVAMIAIVVLLVILVVIRFLRE